MKTVSRIVIGLMFALPFAASAQAGPPPNFATLTVRNGSTVVWNGPVTLNSTPGATTPITPTAGGGSHEVPANSVLALLTGADSSHTEFDITDLQYNSSFSAFYLNCISAPASQCGNWQYAIKPSGGSITYPGVGMDVTTLSNGGSAYVYFGSQRRLTTNATEISPGSSLTVTAENYDPSSDAYTPATDVTIGLIQGDPFGAYTTVSSSPANSQGKATFTIAAAGSYYVGVVEDYYYPNAAITVSVSAPTPTPTSSSGGGGGLTLHAAFDVPSAISFIISAQHADGSFDSIMLSDWAALALKSGDAGDAAKKLADYFVAHPPALQSVSDFERHAMALEALGINPYTGTPVDYIAPIVKAFDGTQIGDASLVNDDIFAVFPLLHAGYTSNDDIIKKTVAFIVSRQKTDGSWEGSVDLTAAAVQALNISLSLPDASGAAQRGVTHLHKQLKSDGGTGNSFSTSWTLQAIASLTDSILIWGDSYLTPQYYLAVLQQSDGGVEPVSASQSTRVWATEYAIPGIRGKTWDSLLASFEKYVPPAPATIASSTVATSTPSTTPDSGQTLNIAAMPQATPPAEPATTTPDTAQAQTAAAAGAISGINWDPFMLLLFILALIALTAGILAKLWRRE